MYGSFSCGKSSRNLVKRIASRPWLALSKFKSWMHCFCSNKWATPHPNKWQPCQAATCPKWRSCNWHFFAALRPNNSNCLRYFDCHFDSHCGNYNRIKRTGSFAALRPRQFSNYDDNGNSCQISLAQLCQRQPSNYDDNPRTESFAVLRPQRLHKYDDDGDSRQTSFAALRQRRPSNHDGHSRQSFAALRQRRPSNHDGDSLQA